MSKGESLIKGKAALADAYADCYSDEPLSKWEALHNGYFEGYEQAEKDLGWISVNDRLPEVSGFYITCVEDNGVAQCVGVTFFNAQSEWEDDDDSFEIVDYWMPIPGLPKEEKK